MECNACIPDGFMSGVTMDPLKYFGKYFGEAGRPEIHEKAGSPGEARKNGMWEKQHVEGAGFALDGEVVRCQDVRRVSSLPVDARYHSSVRPK